MFQQKKTASTQASPGGNASRPTSGTQTVIGPGVRVDGNLKSPSDVELQGTVEGNLEVGGLLVVRESGRLIGDVSAKDVMVEGAVEGRLTAAGRIELGSSGSIQGDLRARAVSISDGAYFQGKVEMSSASETSRRREPVRVPAEASV